jgi:hypothetical protein
MALTRPAVKREATRGDDASCEATEAAATATATTAAATTSAAVISPLILKRAPIGDNQDDYDVLANGVIVVRIFTVPTAPQGRPWMWASGHNGDIKRAAHGVRADARGGDGAGVERRATAREERSPASCCKRG